MGVMTKMRDNTAIVLYVLIISFGILWVVMDVYDPNVTTMGPRSLGEVNGELITLEEYNNRVEYYTNAYSLQSGAAVTPEIRAIYTSQVWNELVNTKLLDQKMNELGINVTDSELREMAFGDNPDPLVRQYFQREDGTIDKFAIENTLTDPKYSQQALAIEIQLREKRRQQKLNNYITAGLQVTQQQIIEEFNNRNSFVDLNFLRFPYSEIDESEIEITESDIQSYYKKNKELYKTEESYRAKFVSFSTLATSEDTSTINGELENLIEGFVESENDSLFLIRNQSTIPYNGVYVDKKELKEDYKSVLDIAEGEVTSVINLGSSAAIIKNIDEKGNQITFAVMSRAYEALPATLDAGFESADEFIYFSTEESSFDDEAERSGLIVGQAFATENNTFITGIGSSQQVLTFLQISDVGDISDPIELESQFVVLEVTEVNKAGYRPLSEVRPQIETQVRNQKRKDILLQNVNEMLVIYSTLEALSEASEKEIQNVEGLAANATVLTGAGREPGIIGSIFGMKENNLSVALEGVTGVYVVYLNSMVKPLANTLDEMTTSRIRTELEQKINQKYLSVWLDQLKADADIVDNRSRLLR